MHCSPRRSPSTRNDRSMATTTPWLLVTHTTLSPGRRPPRSWSRSCIPLLVRSVVNPPIVSSAYRGVYFTATPGLLPRREVLMVIMIVLGLAVWGSIPPLLSRAMRRRGYDGVVWMFVGHRFDLVGAALAALRL